MNMNDKDFNLLKNIMYEQTGVFLKPSKKYLMMSRLRTRLIALNLTSFAEYIKVLERDSNERYIYVNALTTNETYFFRHSNQFKYLYETMLPLIVKNRGVQKEIKIWAGACSTGEEPYSIAIFCKEFLKRHPGCKVKIYASDINTEVLSKAKAAKYHERSLKEIPLDTKKKSFLNPEIDPKKKIKSFQLKEDLKKMVEFSQHNLLKVFREKNLDIIFLRNVMIYFDQDSKQKVVQNLEEALSSGGYLFISLSESLTDIQSNFKSIASGVFQKTK